MNKIKKFFDSLFHRTPLMKVRLDRGPKDGAEKTFVFLHGIAASYNTFRATLSEIALDADFKNCRLIALDLIGFGRSPKLKDWPYTYESYSKSLRKTLKKLKVQEPVVLVGHSMGCLIAVDFVLRQKEKDHRLQVESMILVSPPIMKPEDARKLPERFMIRAYEDLAKHTHDKAVLTITSFISKVSSFENKNFDTPAFRRSMDNLITNAETWKKIRKISIPTTILHGVTDPLVVGENLTELAKKNRNIRYISSLGGHDILGPKQKKLIKAMADTMRSVRVRSAAKVTFEQPKLDR